MRNGNIRRMLWPLVALTAALASGASAQTAPGAGGIDVPAIVKNLGLPKDKSDAAQKALTDLVAQIQDSSKALVTLLTQKKPEQLLDPQLSARISQIQKAFSLKFEKFQLDLADAAGQDKALEITTRFKAAIPSILLDAPALAATANQPALAGAAAKKPAEVPLGAGPLFLPAPAGGSSLDLSVSASPTPASGSGMDGGMEAGKDASMMSMMSGMGNDKAQMGMAAMPSGGTQMAGMTPAQASGSPAMAGMPGMPSGSGTPSAASDQLLLQFQNSNALAAQMLSSLATQSSGTTQAQLQLLAQIIANQSATLQLLMNSSAQAASASSGSMPSGGMSMM